MSDWLHGLPVFWMTILVFGITYLVTAGIYAVIAVFAVGERARSFKAIAPGLLTSLQISTTPASNLQRVIHGLMAQKRL